MRGGHTSQYRSPTCLDEAIWPRDPDRVTDGPSDYERVKALGAEIAGHDEHALPTRAAPVRPPRWSVRIRLAALAVFAAQAIYGLLAHDSRLLISGVVLFVVWLGRLAR